MKHSKSYGLYVIIFVAILTSLYFLSENNADYSGEPYVYSDMIEDIMNNEGDITKIEVISSAGTSNSGTAHVYLKSAEDGGYRSVVINDIQAFSPYLDKAMSEGTTVSSKENQDNTGFFSIIIPILFMGFFVMIIFTIIQNLNGGGGPSKGMNFGKSRAKLVFDPFGTTNFDSVAGLDEEKKELQEVVQFLMKPEKFKEIGARIPKGFLLVGPPGTGKTLLAKAVAGEAGVPFFSISGSDFVEMYVGVGASRVRDLFEDAKKHRPCVIFIDEIDAVGRKRGAGLGGSHDEREQTLNQLLVEMDGFAANEGIVVLAATNRVDILDQALLRPGRFDRKVVVNVPDMKGRLEMLYLHSRKKKVSDDVDFRVIAQQSAGFTGADIENLLNESAIIAVRRGLDEITMDCVREAHIKVSVGTEKKNKIITKKDKNITAYHEAGHALLHEMLNELDHVQIVSIIPTGSAGGYTMYAPLNDNSYTTKTKMFQDIVSLLGGRVAEDIFFNEITTGASSDISRATKIARAMVTRFGMSELGPIQYGEDEQEVFLGRDFSNGRQYSDEMASKIDAEVTKIISEANNKAYELIREYSDIVEKCVALLLEREKIVGEEFRELFPEGVIPEKEEREDVTAQLEAFEETVKENETAVVEREKKRQEEFKKRREEQEKLLKESLEKNKKKGQSK